MRLSDACVYTIVHPDLLLRNDRGTADSVPITEKKSWRTAEKLLAKATSSDEVVPLLLADSRQVDRWLGWAELRGVNIRETAEGVRTDYAFGNLRRPPPWHRSQLELLSNGKPIGEDHIRPYVLFRTPELLRETAREDSPDLRDWLQSEEAVRDVFDHNFSDDPGQHRDAHLVLAAALEITGTLAPQNTRCVLTPGQLRLHVGSEVVLSFGESTGSYLLYVDDEEDDGPDDALSMLEMFNKYAARFRAKVVALAGQTAVDLPHARNVERYLRTFRAGTASPGVPTSPSNPDDLRSDEVLDETDARARVLAEIAVRQGQGAFRQALIEAYAGRCAITGCGTAHVLEAAHILPYRGEHRNTVENGLLLRSDLHVLFDLGLLHVDPETFVVFIDASLKDSDYGTLDGARLRLPAQASHHPTSVILRARLKQFAKAPA